jgi:GNAT superfamily N-acetyltransferase
MNPPTAAADGPRVALSIVELPWCARRYATIALDAACPASAQGAMGASIAEVAASTAQAFALDGVRLRASPGAIRPLVRAGWEFWHLGCVRTTDTGWDPPLPEGYALKLCGHDHIEAVRDPLAASLHAGIPACERAWRDRFDFDAAAERWLSDFLARGDLLLALLWRGTLAGYGLLSISGANAVLEDVSVLPSHAGRGLSGALLAHLQALACEHGFDVVCGTVMHPVPAVRRRLIRRLLAQGWYFHEAHFALPMSARDDR